MNRRILLLSAVCLAALLVVVGIVTAGSPMGTGFTYQGFLKYTGSPANGLYDFEFTLFDAATSSNQIGGIVARDDVTVTNGLFVVPLDFGSAAFNGEARWLAIGVRPGTETGAYTALTPRQALTPTPYSLYASTATTATIAVTTTYAVSAGNADLLEGQSAGDFATITHTHTMTGLQSLESFEERFAIPTNTAYDSEPFTIGSDVYLAVANHYNGSTWNIDSKIYRWDGTVFSLTQSISTHGATDWESFTIGSDDYLAVANSRDGGNFHIDSKIYRWNGTSFVEFQSISAICPNDWEFFTIGSDAYLAVANYYDGAFNHDSNIYRWNGTAFSLTQSIPTIGALDWESFSIGGDTYLAVANAQNGSTHNIDSKIYRWNGTTFSLTQSIPTHHAADWESFSIGGDTYLAVANAYNDSTSNIDSKLYRWNGMSFVEFQSIPTHGAADWEFFTVGEDAYLAVANSGNGTTGNIDSKLYHWNGASFVEFQSIPTHTAWDWAFFSIGSDPYLVVANQSNDSSNNIDSKVYKARLTNRDGIWGQNDSDVYYNDGNVGIGTTLPQSALQVEGYVQLDTLIAAPPAADCDNALERGRMMVDIANNRLYLCTNSGWTWASLTP